MAETFAERANNLPWRKTFSVHPAAAIFPLLPRKELEELAADIKANGVQMPLLLRRTQVDGALDELVDGRCRLDAMALAGVPLLQPDGKTNFPVRLLEPDENVYDAVIRVNVLRRHLTKEQRDDAMLKMVALCPELSDRQIAKSFGADHKTIGAARKKGIATGEVSPVARTIGADGKSRPVKRNSSRAAERAAERERAALEQAQAQVKVERTAAEEQRARWEAEMNAAKAKSPPVEPAPEPTPEPPPTPLRVAENPELAHLLVTTKAIEARTAASIARTIFDWLSGADRVADRAAVIAALVRLQKASAPAALGDGAEHAASADPAPTW